ncbi:xanthine dehydrogenase accessory protein XdhC [Rhodovulum sulfidophilum]|uniref:Xanthine dehydrogenase accessory protein XdhC n=1 Tax=Rhodovulum visakhapatnamense TaxID=364297 RepID=A0ABS1RC08_9RHOB|nr:xanthine dehydrogenase accessory protein XdhC [Rhodovulum visakhapatnamense]MBL3568658.1 xanthine dehydrogenase accessory protein XdhC [Rhodovulum visakhapatnamense]MBL3577179.1 xanthine dehydrogenase accessory protein XdhC [Rhodovulum visakhapatnamense]OLS45734.1 xanthine dehydrogenase accessory protein XdhC [Rhodovulum sulfidophilum]
MSLDRDALARAVAAEGRVVRVAVAEIRGSAPREAGTAMLVWAEGQSGTIGGGALEFEAAAGARRLLRDRGSARVARVALGPGLGQCCGGAVTLVSEVFDAEAVAALTGEVHARRVEGDGPMPLPVRRALAGVRGGLGAPPVLLKEGWFLEPVAPPARALWIWGAGHVGRALVGVLAPLPGLAITWVDTAAGRFPDVLPDGVVPRAAPDPAALVPEAPTEAHHLILTYSHALDLALCHALLVRGFGSAGLIGSDSKWARFRARLGQLGHSPAEIARICCPIGQKSLGKHPQAIAIGVAAALLSEGVDRIAARDIAG